MAYSTIPTLGVLQRYAAILSGEEPATRSPALPFGGYLQEEAILGRSRLISLSLRARLNFIQQLIG